ncbi:CD151 antigen-like [Hydractinia symbiolongicarpus]|uniref:CD151 antigen-like n=1 Tax=Hydractinia symbiolongicarpus TaxID=13093 RepID=UPI00254AA5FD|nr:CD151 antigen-like [Hydractinia symbiolongicarpus]XP_057317325.1 CD151 antigen-like [Hydractinia symbiolongicarpus]
MGDLSCGMTCLKYLLFAFNFVFWICGIAVMAVGIYSRIQVGKWDDIIDDSTVPSAANLMIAAGALVMLIGFLGCCGAWKQNKCLLISYAICLILIFVLEIAAGIYAYVKRDDIQKELETGLTKGINTTYSSQDTKADKALREAIDWFQENVECCGAESPKDWSSSVWGTTKNNTLWAPESCCAVAGCSKKAMYPNLDDFLAKANIHKEGCVQKGKDWVKERIGLIGGAGVGIAFIQLLGIIFAILLCRAIGESEMA